MSDEHIVICDDEPEMRESLMEYFEGRGYRVGGASNGEALARLLAVQSPDLVILDVRMPKVDGLTALKEIRAKGNLPVILLTAADESIDRILGLELGADDYVGKPVDLRELEARVRAVLRRGASADNQPVDEAPIKFFGLCLDVVGARLLDRNGDVIGLTAMEFELLRTFLKNRGRVLSRDQILEQAHKRGWDPFDRSIDLRVSRLRRKIEPAADGQRLIRTVRGIGYVFEGESSFPKERG